MDAVAPADLSVDGAGVWVEQQLARVTARTACRIPGSVHAVAIALAGADPGQVSVPHIPGPLGQVQAFLVTALVEQTQLHAFRDLREDTEGGARAIGVGTKRVGCAGQGAWRRYRVVVVVGADSAGLL